jgi:hypothetical protein
MQKIGSNHWVKGRYHLLWVLLKHWDPIYKQDEGDEIVESLGETSCDSIKHPTHEEHVDEESTQSSMPSFHEYKGLVSHDPPQILNLMMRFLKIWKWIILKMNS